jgi:hypothetical protein
MVAGGQVSLVLFVSGVPSNGKSPFLMGKSTLNGHFQ